MSLEGELLFSGVDASSSFCFSAILNGQKFLHIQLEVFKVFSESVGMCVAIFFLVCLYLYSGRFLKQSRSTYAIESVYCL